MVQVFGFDLSSWRVPQIQLKVECNLKDFSDLVRVTNKGEVPPNAVSLCESSFSLVTDEEHLKWNTILYLFLTVVAKKVHIWKNYTFFYV